MAKRDTGVGKHRRSHSHKTKKRLEAKKVMLAGKKIKKKKQKKHR
jgi:hypothetical protein